MSITFTLSVTLKSGRKTEDEDQEKNMLRHRQTGYQHLKIAILGILYIYILGLWSCPVILIPEQKLIRKYEGVSCWL